jgi:HAD superfamily hydrolase (TIGR01509 family)
LIAVPLKNIKACIFDFDGTIIVSEHVHMKAWEDLAAEENKDLPAGFLEESVGMSDQQLVKILAKAWDYSPNEERILERKRHFYLIRCPHESAVVPGVVEAIKDLVSRRVPVAIATSSTRSEVEPVLIRLGIHNIFQSICTVEDIGHPKPHPEIYQLAAARLGVSPGECLAFEDSIAGVSSARAAGCCLVTMQTLYSEDRLGPALMSVKDFQDKRLMKMMRSIGC